ncbi:hypothetical protein HPB52_011046 [Rhipicephalus sanguineus]|uniref:Uncharacterized protein n=1 Tax=Rhipicephalus sanguineus TaxID=34632 RepID=A0A9D4PTV6_RHISA|nr:hypothetical protein HPB52_011046 [Rhipicephalus sanguineus]
MTRLAVLTLGCLLLAAAGARPMQPRPRDKRAVLWEDLAEEPALRGEVAVPVRRLRDNRYYEDWFLDRVLPRVQRDNRWRLADSLARRLRLYRRMRPDVSAEAQGCERQDATWGTDEHNQPAELPSYRKWVPKISLGRAKEQGRTPEQQEDVASPKHEDYSPTNGVTPSSSTTPTVDRTEKARSTTLAKGADDDIGQCPAQQVIPKPQLTTDTKSRGLMEALFGTKLTTLVTATVKATKNTGTTTKDYSTAKATTKEATRTKSHPTTVRTTQQASNRTASERPKIASAIQVAPKNDIGKFVINRFARVSRESAYMEHMEPMVAFACRVHLWIIGVLCALVLLLAVALFTKKERQVEPVVPTRPPEPPYTPPMPVSPASPLIKRPPTEVWEDDLYDVSEIAKLEKRHSTI